MSFKVTSIILHKLTISAAGHGSQIVLTSVDYSRDFRNLTTGIKKEVNNRLRQKEHRM
jgi:hypothetical protein